MALSNLKAFTTASMALIAALTLMAAFAKPPPKKPATTKADAAAGKKVYATNGCGGCHKIGETGGDAGPNLSKFAADKTKDAKWTAIQIQSPNKHTKETKMPPYADKVKGKDLDNVVAYLLTLKG